MIPLLSILLHLVAIVAVNNWMFTLGVLSFFAVALFTALSRPARTAAVQYVQVQVVPRSANLATSWRNKHGHVRYSAEETEMN